MPDSNTLAQQICALLSEKFHLRVPSLDTDLINTGLVDSLMFVEFLVQLEQKFGVHMSLQDLELDRIRTVTRIAAFVATKVRTGTSSAFENDHRRPPAPVDSR